MKTSYRELDYESGKAIQTLRGRIGLTQAGLAEHLGVSTRTVNEWEAGGSSPKEERLKALIALAICYQALPKGCEAEEIRVLWKTTRQKRLLDERWLSTLLQEPDLAPPSLPEITNHTPAATPPASEAQGKSDDPPTVPFLHEHENANAPKTTRRHRRLLGILIVLVIVAITGAGGMLLLQTTSTQTHSYPEYLTGHGTLAFFDPLSQEGESKWSSGTNGHGGTCQFTDGAYHISQQPNGYFIFCSANALFSNFAFEVQLTITQGDYGGMIFRQDVHGHDYYFSIGEDGTYAVMKFADNHSSHVTVLYHSHTSAMHTGLGHENKIAVVASGSTMTFYINEHQIDQEQDSSYPSGKIALIADPYYPNGHATDVAYRNARLWTL